MNAELERLVRQLLPPAPLADYGTMLECLELMRLLAGERVRTVFSVPGFVTISLSRPPRPWVGWDAYAVPGYGRTLAVRLGWLTALLDLDHRRYR
jgi:hypothetical protein